MKNKKQTVVVTEDRKVVDELAKKAKKQKSYENLGKAGNTCTIIASPSLVASLLSPFDFEGPIVEIICALALVAGIAMKKISRKNLDKLNAINTDGEQHSTFSLDREDANKIGEIVQNYSNKTTGRKLKK